MNCIQQELPLLQPPSFEDIMVRDRIRGITVSFNPRLRSGWHALVRPGKTEVVLPITMEQATHEVKSAVLSWAALRKPRLRRNRSGYYDRKRRLENIVRQYLELHGPRTRQRRIADPDQLSANSKGELYDLKEIRDSVNAKFLGGKVRTHVRWGSFGSVTSFHTHVRDSKGNRHDLVTIAGAYNHSSIPRFAIEAVVYHEMLHIVYPPYKRAGRNVIHGPKFKAAEQALPCYTRWRTWERNHHQRIIRSMQRKKKTGNAPRSSLV